MKPLTAVVRPYVVDDIREAMDRLAVLGMTVTEARGYGRQKGHVEVYRVPSIPWTSCPRCGSRSCSTTRWWTGPSTPSWPLAAPAGSPDGKVWVTPVDTVVRVRTGERGPDAV